MAATLDESSGYFPRFITSGNPASEPDQPPVHGELFEASCWLAKLLGEFVEDRNDDQIRWLFHAMQQLKEHAIEYYQERHGKPFDDSDL